LYASLEEAAKELPFLGEDPDEEDIYGGIKTLMDGDCEDVYTDLIYDSKPPKRQAEVRATSVLLHGVPRVSDAFLPPFPT
jgi:hypothetical protein